MSALLMLDTNAVSAFIKNSSQTLNTILSERPFCISVITEAELRFGLARRTVNIDLRRIVENYLACVDIQPWTSACAQRYGLLRAELEAQGKPLAPMDLLIASHAMAADCTLVSADRAFSQVPGLRLIDWSANSLVPATSDAASRVRNKLARTGSTARDVADAITQTRTRQAATKTKPGKKPKAK